MGEIILCYGFRILVEGASNLFETFQNPAEDKMKINTEQQVVWKNESFYDLNKYDELIDHKKKTI